MTSSDCSPSADYAIDLLIYIAILLGFHPRGFRHYLVSMVQLCISLDFLPEVLRPLEEGRAKKIRFLVWERTLG